MRLLNARTLELESFVGDYPSYAILSHCWDFEEVLFSDLFDLAEAKKKVGFNKVERTCEQAVKDGFSYVWIDTCCIDKSSSAELSEAINSMFTWYRNSDKCYAYLADVDGLEDFARSKWFTRAWTLQELLAPSHVQNGGASGMDFFSSRWVNLGSKSDLGNRLKDICGIEKEYLEGQSIYSASISMRMSWAAERHATRSEDIAYSLLGIFDVNMPLLYGEGKLKAFRRLQEEIMKISEDETLFAWESGDFQTGSTAADVLASDPKDFSEARHLVPFASDEPDVPYSMTHRGLRIWLQLFRIEDLKGGIQNMLREAIRPLRSPVMIWSSNNLVWAILKCHVSHDFHHFVAIPLQHIAAGVYTRDLSTSVALVDTGFLPLISQHYALNGSAGEKEIYIRNSRISSISNSVQRRFGFLFRNITQGIKVARESYPIDSWNRQDRILQGGSSTQKDRFWHASLTLLLPSAPHATVKYATYLSLGCENGPAMKMPRAWCYLDDKAIPMNDIDLLAFHETAGAKQPRHEVNRYQGTPQDIYFGIKVSITESKVLGQRMFVVDIEYIQGDNKLGIPTRSTNMTVPPLQLNKPPEIDKNLPSITLVDLSYD
ncbi:het domain protein [Stagonosporopsis vannaccii]|nr:het domain protein [Stagonosporopsis vannaccii]